MSIFFVKLQLYNSTINYSQVRTVSLCTNKHVIPYPSADTIVPSVIPGCSISGFGRNLFFNISANESVSRFVCFQGLPSSLCQPVAVLCDMLSLANGAIYYLSATKKYVVGCGSVLVGVATHVYYLHTALCCVAARTVK